MSWGRLGLFSAHIMKILVMDLNGEETSQFLVAQCWSNLFLKLPTDGAVITYSGSSFQGVTTRFAKNLILKLHDALLFLSLRQ